MATEANRRFAAVVRLQGTEDVDFYSCIESITVTEDVENGSSFQIRIALLREEEGTWPYLDDERLEPWNRITIIAAFPDGDDVIMDGYISHTESSSSSEAGVALNIRGVDAAYALNLEEKCKVWQGMT